MVGRAKLKRRQAAIDALYLLGYNFIDFAGAEFAGYRYCSILIVKPEGGIVTSDNRPFDYDNYVAFRYRHEAAEWMLERLGVNVRTFGTCGEDGARRSRVPEVFEQRNRLERVSALPHRYQGRRR